MSELKRKRTETTFSPDRTFMTVKVGEVSASINGKQEILDETIYDYVRLEHAVEVLAEEICKRKNLEGGVVDSENFVLPYSKLIVLCRAEARELLGIKEGE